MPWTRLVYMHKVARVCYCFVLAVYCIIVFGEKIEMDVITRVSH